MQQILQQSTAATTLVGPILDSTGAAYTGAVIGDLNLTKNGTTAAMAAAATLTHDHNGHYLLVFTTGNTDTLGRLDVSINKATYAMPQVRFEVLTTAVFNTLVANGTLASTTSGRTIVTDAAGLVDANAVKLGPTGAGTAQTARDIGASVLLSTGTGAGQLDFTSGVVKSNPVQWLGGTIPAVNVTGVPKVDVVDWLGSAPNALISGRLDSNVQASAASLTFNLTGNITGNLSGSVGSVTGAVGSVTGAVGSVTGNVGGSVASVTAAVTLGANDSFTSDSGTAQAGAGSTITLRSGASATDSIYNGCFLKINSGTGVGQARVIVGYVGSTKVATVDRAWQTNPDNTSVYTVVFADEPKTDSNLAVTAGTVSDKTAYSLSQAFPTNFSSLSIDGSGRVDLGKWIGVAPNALISNRVDSNVQASAASLTFNLTGNVTGNLSGSVGSVTGAVGSVTGAVGSVTGNVGGSVASVTAAVSLSGADTPSLHSGTAQATGNDSTHIKLAAGASSIDNEYNGLRVKLYGGTGASQSRTITAYSGTTKIATVDWAFTTTPDNTTTYAVTDADGPAVNSSLQVATTASDPWATALPGAYGAGTAGKIIGSNLDALISSRMATFTLPTNFSSFSIDGSGRIDLGKILGGASQGAAGYVGIDWGHVNAPTTTVGLTGTTISSGQVVASVTGAVGSVTGAVTSDLSDTAQRAIGAIVHGSKTWNVATAANGGSDSNVGNASSPFLTISHAASTAAAGDIILVGPGAFQENSGVTLKASQKLIGSGMDSTVINSTYEAAGIVQINNNVTITDLTINGTVTNADEGQASISDNAAVTGVTIRRVKTFGDTDGLYIAFASQVQCFDCLFTSRWDCVAGLVTTGTTLAVIDCFRCELRSTGPNFSAPNSNGIVECSLSVIRFFDCYLHSVSTNSNASRTTYGITISGSALHPARVELHRCVLEVSVPDGTVNDLISNDSTNAPIWVFNTSYRTDRNSNAPALIQNTPINGSGQIAVGALASGAITPATFASGVYPAKVDLIDAPNATAVTALANGLLDLANAIDPAGGADSLRKAMRLVLAATAGKLAGAATTTNTIRDTSDAKTRITATVDSSGNRSAVVYDLT